MKPEEIAEVMRRPIARELLSGSIPARLAYTGRDGDPRVIPIGFLWNGAAFVVCTSTNAPKVRALEANPKVALTIDTTGFPPRVLLVRGTAALETVDGIPREYLEGQRGLVGDEHYDEWEAGVRSLYKQMVRITITPHWAKLLDFETTLPSAVEELMRQQAAG